MKTFMTAVACCALLGGFASTANAQTVLFQSDPNVSDPNGFADFRSDSTAVGRLTVSADTQIEGIGVLDYLTGAANLKFFIANADTGAFYYLSGGKSFGADTGGVSVGNMTYKLSDAFSFTLLAGTDYAVGSIADGQTYTYANFTQTNTDGVFSSYLGNVNVYGYNSPFIDTNRYCCSIGFEVLGGAVPEPASWALMVGGFGLIGGAMRRRVGIAATA